MSCKILDGKTIANEILSELRVKVQDFRQKHKIAPTLVALMVGENPASQVYVRRKIKAAEEVGIYAFSITADNQENCIKREIECLNWSPLVHGYILQLPLPEKADPSRYFELFDQKKDVDVLHPANVGRLVQGNPRYKPCTPHGIQMMFNRSGIQVSGKRVAIINRSDVVGKPLSSMLIQNDDVYANATVTVCHDGTPEKMLKEITLDSDIVIVAVGKPGFLTADMVKPGATVVDVGINRVGKKVVGDVDFENVKEVAGAISPVPGGVGPLTVAMLLENTLLAAQSQI